MSDAEHERTHLLGKELYECGLLVRFVDNYNACADTDFLTWGRLPEAIQNECCNVAEYICEREATLHDLLLKVANELHRYRCLGPYPNVPFEKCRFALCREVRQVSEEAEI